MFHHDRAIAEQLRSFICPEQGLAESKKRGTATYQQITGYRRRTEAIMIEMIDKWSKEDPSIRPKRIRGPHRRAAKRNKAQAVKKI